MGEMREDGDLEGTRCFVGLLRRPLRENLGVDDFDVDRSEARAGAFWVYLMMRRVAPAAERSFCRSRASMTNVDGP